MKKRPALLLLLGTLILFGGGCGSGGDETATNPSPAPVPAQTPAVPAPSAPPAAAPIPEASSAPLDFASFCLIPSTNAKQRQQEITAGRTNPFSLIPIQAKLPAPIPAQVSASKDGMAKNASKLVSNNSNSSKQSGSRLIAKNSSGIPAPKPPVITASKSRVAACNALKASSSGKLSKSSQSKSDVLACDRLDSSDPMLSLPVPLPNPSEAKAVAILGVLQIGNKPFAIVQAPGESVPRYITAGGSLVNGEVMVKSINSFSDNPTVTLVQYNQEVVREVGEPTVQPAGAKPEAEPPSVENQTSYLSRLSRESGELERLSLNP